jgi:DNA-binding transcriptional LysR family regulator
MQEIIGIQCFGIRNDGEPVVSHLAEMETFARVAALGSFTSAARDLGISPASVTRRVLLLEESLGAKLLNRTSRKLSLTEAGRRYYGFAERTLAEIRREEMEIRAVTHGLEGSLKVVVSKSFGALHMGQAVAAFITLYPKVRISIIVSDVSLNSLDPIDLGFDLAIRLGEPRNSRLIVQRIGTANWIACASPSYLGGNGEPRAPEDLIRHICVTNPLYPPDGKWTFHSGQSKSEISVAGSVTTNSVIVARQLVVSGLGIALLPDYCCSDDLASGVLRQILPDYSLPPQAIRVLFPRSALQPRKVKLFVDFLRDRFGKGNFGRDKESLDSCYVGRQMTARPDLARQPEATPVVSQRGTHVESVEQLSANVAAPRIAS